MLYQLASGDDVLAQTHAWFTALPVAEQMRTTLVLPSRAVMNDFLLRFYPYSANTAQVIPSLQHLGHIAGLARLPGMPPSVFLDPSPVVLAHEVVVVMAQYIRQQFTAWSWSACLEASHAVWRSYGVLLECQDNGDDVVVPAWQQPILQALDRWLTEQKKFHPTQWQQRAVQWLISHDASLVPPLWIVGSSASQGLTRQLMQWLLTAPDHHRIILPDQVSVHQPALQRQHPLWPAQVMAGENAVKQLPSMTTQRALSVLEKLMTQSSTNQQPVDETPWASIQGWLCDDRATTLVDAALMTQTALMQQQRVKVVIQSHKHRAQFARLLQAWLEPQDTAVVQQPNWLVVWRAWLQLMAHPTIVWADVLSLMQSLCPTDHDTHMQCGMWVVAQSRTHKRLHKVQHLLQAISEMPDDLTSIKAALLQRLESCPLMTQERPPVADVWLWLQSLCQVDEGSLAGAAFKPAIEQLATPLSVDEWVAVIDDWLQTEDRPYQLISQNLLIVSRNDARLLKADLTIVVDDDDMLTLCRDGSSTDQSRMYHDVFHLWLEQNVKWLWVSQTEQGQRAAPWWWSVLKIAQPTATERHAHNSRRRQWCNLDMSGQMAVRRPFPVVQRAHVPQTISATQVEKLMLDPYRFYIEHVLNIQPGDDYARRAQPHEHGAMVHRWMSHIFDKTTYQLQPLSRCMLLADDMLEQYTDSQIERYFWRYHMAAIWQRLYEQQDRQSAPLMRRHLEVSGAIDMTIDASTIQLKARADRIDCISTKEWHILDYKTGTIPSQKMVDLGLRCQLLIEGLIAMRGGFGDPPEQVQLYYWSILKQDRAKCRAVMTPDLANETQAGIETMLGYLLSGQAVLPAMPPSQLRRDGNLDAISRVSEWWPHVE